MKILKYFAISILLTGFVSANNTGFIWSFSNGFALDADGNGYASGEASVFTFLNFDLSTLPSYTTHSTIVGAFQVHIDDLISPINAQNITAFPDGSFWGVSNDITQSNADRVGSIASAIVVSGGGLSEINVGAFIGQAENSYTINNLGEPAGPTQQFNPGSAVTNVQVIPEPGTLALVLIAGVGMALKFSRRRS